MLQAHGRHAISAKTTASGSDPPANATPAGIDAAMAAPGAMSVMLWNKTSRRPIAFRRRPGPVLVSAVVATAASLVPSGANDHCGDVLTAGGQQARLQRGLRCPFVLKAVSGPWRGRETSAATSAPSRALSPSVRRTSIPGSTRSSLTNVPLVECSSLIVASPVSLTVTVACRLDTFSLAAKAAATRDSPGSRPSTSDVPAGTSTLPVGKASRRTTGEIGPVGVTSVAPQAGQVTRDWSATGRPQAGQVAGAPGAALSSRRRYSCITVGGVTSSSTGPLRGRFVPQVKQIRSSWLTAAAQPGQVSVAMSSSGTAVVGAVYHQRLTRSVALACPGTGAQAWRASVPRRSGRPRPGTAGVCAQAGQ